MRSIGAPVREIAAALQCSYDKLTRHFRHLRKAAESASGASAQTPLELSDQALEELISQCEATRLASQASGDSRTSLEAIKILSRLHNEKHRRLIAAKKAASDKGTQSGEKLRITPEEIDALLKKYNVARVTRLERIEAARKAGYLNCPMCLGDAVLIHPSQIPKLWAPIKALYDSWCDQREAEVARAKEQIENASNTATAIV